jgi:hypothetical protein
MPLLVEWRTDSCARSVTRRLLHGQHAQGMYRLRSFAIVHDRVSVLMEPLQGVTNILKKWQAQNATNRWIAAADAPELIRTIESTPVRAGLTQRPEEWPWSSAWAD